MKRTVLDPLAMTSSGYTAPADPARSASPHDIAGAPIATPQPAGRTRNPAAGLYTTAADYARFVIAVQRGTGLSPAAHARMLTAQIQVTDAGPESIGRRDPELRRDLAWGLGWGLATTTAGAAFWHWGDNGGTKALIVALEQPRLAVIVFANSVNGLSITRDIVATALGIAQPGLDWLGYEAYDAPVRVLARAIRAHGAAPALADYRSGRSARIPEPDLNRLGYQLAGIRRMSDAIAVLAQNVADHPASANTYDSLAEVYDQAGERDKAIANYRRSVALDPSNTHGVTELARLTGSAAPTP